MEVYDASTGKLLATYQLADAATVDAGLSLVNDVIVLNDAAYFTDSFHRRLSGATRQET